MYLYTLYLFLAIKIIKFKSLLSKHFHYQQYFQISDPSGECNPELRLKGHQKEGYCYIFMLFVDNTLLFFYHFFVVETMRPVITM